MTEPKPKSSCRDCGLDYAVDSFADLLIGQDQWNIITIDDGPEILLCPNCICRRIAKLEMTNVPCAFVSGGLLSMSRTELSSLLGVHRLQKELDRLNDLIKELSTRQ